MSETPDPYEPGRVLSALDIECPRFDCSAMPGEPCQRLRGSGPLSKPHNDRALAARLWPKYATKNGRPLAVSAPARRSS